MFDSCEIRVHPDGSAIARMGTISQGQGHQTTYAQIIASEAGIAASPDRGRGGRHVNRPLRAGHLRLALDARWPARRSRAPAAKSAKKARKIAAHLLEVAPDDLEFDLDSSR